MPIAALPSALPILTSLPALVPPSPPSGSLDSLGLGPLDSFSASADAATTPFSSMLSEAISKVESFGKASDGGVQRFLSGEGEELHSVAIKAQQAELSFDLFLQVRNKVVNAYEEIMRMQI